MERMCVCECDSHCLFFLAWTSVFSHWCAISANCLGSFSCESFFSCQTQYSGFIRKIWACHGGSFCSEEISGCQMHLSAFVWKSLCLNIKFFRLLENLVLTFPWHFSVRMLSLYYLPIRHPQKIKIHSRNLSFGNLLMLRFSRYLQLLRSITRVFSRLARKYFKARFIAKEIPSIKQILLFTVRISSIWICINN